MKCFQEILLMRELFLKSKIFTDEQLIRANIKELLTGPMKLSPFDLWGIEKVIKKGEFKPFDENALGSSFKKYFNQEENSVSFEHEEWVMK